MNNSKTDQNKKIAFVTYESLVQLSGDDILVKAELEKEGFTVHPVCWNDKKILWESFDMIILRSTWDYHLHINEFTEWICKVEKLNAPLWNPAQVIKWNLKKNYLQDLEKKGIHIAPTVWLEKGNRVSLIQILESNNWENSIIKPVVSATAHNTHLISKFNASSYDEFMNEELSKCDFIVQQFLPEISKNGEWSIIFFNKKYSHSVLKKVKPGDFRVQENYGGTVSSLNPPGKIIIQAQEILNLISSPILYARVDGVEIKGNFVLMELELVEPVLFFRYNKDAPGNFIRAVKSRM